MSRTINGVEKEVIVVKCAYEVGVVVAIGAKHEARHIVEVSAEGFAHVVVELIAERRGVHHEDGSVETILRIVHFGFKEIEIGNCRKIIILRCVGVETHKFHATRDEREIKFAVKRLEGLVARSEEVVIANEGHVRIAKFRENIVTPLKLPNSSCVGEVTAVNYKVDVRSLIQICHLVASVFVPEVRIADESHAERVLIGKSSFNLSNVSGVDIRFALKIDVVRVRIKNAIAGRK